MKIYHISDLHFGCHDPALADALLGLINSDMPDLVIASGDITQSALTEEFRQAAAFFSALKPALLCIPGNHDLPGMDITRFLDPFGRYRDHIQADLEPEWVSPVAHVKGMNSARMVLPSLNWAWGSVSPRQAAMVRDTFQASASRWKILTLHHPLTCSKDFPLDHSLYHADRLMRAIQDAKVDIVLAGHQHHASFENRETSGHMTIFVNASTAISKRIRRQPNGFNRLELSDNSLRIERVEHDGVAFRTVSAESFVKTLRKAEAAA